MGTYDIKCYENLNKEFEQITNNWENNKISNFDCLTQLKDLKRNIYYIVCSNDDVHSSIINLYLKISSVVNEIKEISKTIYILEVDKTKKIVCTDESLIQKCIARLGKNTQMSTYKIKVCENEKDLDEIFLDENLDK